MAEWIIEIKDGKFPIGKWTELVRCKDCEYRSEKAFRSVDGDVVEYNYCSQWNRESNINGYCYKGERKDEVKE